MPTNELRPRHEAETRRALAKVPVSKLSLAQNCNQDCNKIDEQENKEMKTDDRIDPRVIRTRKLLLDAFMETLAEKRYDDITVQDITTRATVNRATFYAHFVDKCALVDALIQDTFAQTLSCRQAKPLAEVYEYLQSLFLAVTDHWTEINAQCPQRYQLFESLAEAEIKKQLRNNIVAWLSSHNSYRHQDEQHLALAATIISWSIYGAGAHWAQAAHKQPAEAFAREALPFIASTLTVLDGSASDKSIHSEVAQ